MKHTSNKQAARTVYPERLSQLQVIKKLVTSLLIFQKASLKYWLRMTQSHLVLLPPRILNCLQGELGSLLLVSRRSLY